MIKKESVQSIIDQHIQMTCKKKTIKFEDLCLDEDFNLLKSGIYDSIGVLNLISYLEDRLETEIDLSAYSPSEFTNYKKVIEIIEKSL